MLEKVFTKYSKNLQEMMLLRGIMLLRGSNYQSTAETRELIG